MLIGEVSEESGISARMLRHYDSIGLVSPTGRTTGGYRQYSEDDMRRLFHVEGLRSLGLSLAEVGDALGDPSFSPAALVEQLIVRTLDRLGREQDLLGRLTQVRASHPTAWSDVLRTVGLMRGLAVGDPSARLQFVLAHRTDEDRDAALLVEAALDEADPVVAGALYWALARIPDTAIPILQEALDSSSAERRHRAVRALVKIGSPAATRVLADAAGHPDPLVSGRAALVRGARGEPDAIPTLIALVVEGRDDVEAADVLTALASQDESAQDVAAEVAAALTTADGPARKRLVVALAAIPGPLAAETVHRLVDDSDLGVAATASFLVRQRGPDA